MASWMVHFRIADGLMDYLKVNQEQFIVGNIGPDCGEPNEDWSAFDPPANISHWTNTGMKRNIDSEGFYQEYTKNKADKGKESFYLGYYVHLVTDILWAVKIHIPTKEKFRQEFEQDKNFIWEVKKDWYDLDHMYLKNNPDFRTFRIFDKIKAFPNIYLGFYSQTAIEKQIRYISEFYNSHEGNLNREYPYLNKEKADQFVTEVIEYILEDLKNKKFLF